MKLAPRARRVLPGDQSRHQRANELTVPFGHRQPRRRGQRMPREHQGRCHRARWDVPARRQWRDPLRCRWPGRRDRSDRSPGFPPKQEPVLARFRLARHSALDDKQLWHHAAARPRSRRVRAVNAPSDRTTALAPSASRTTALHSEPFRSRRLLPEEETRPAGSHGYERFATKAVARSPPCNLSLDPPIGGVGEGDFV